VCVCISICVCVMSECAYYVCALCMCFLQLVLCFMCVFGEGVRVWCRRAVAHVCVCVFSARDLTWPPGVFSGFLLFPLL
jgi:hypothetical protein